MRKKPLSTIQEESVSIGWRDKILKVNGMIPILLMMLGGIIWFGSQIIARYIDGSADTKHYFDEQTVHISQEHATLSGEHKQLLQTQTRMADTLEIQTYLMTKSEKDRQRYELEMPESLRRQMRREH